MKLNETHCLLHPTTDLYSQSKEINTSVLTPSAVTTMQTGKRFHFMFSLLVAVFALVFQSVHAQTKIDNLDCNTPTPWIQGTVQGISVMTSSSWTGTYGITLGSIANPGNVIDDDLENHGSIIAALSVGGGGRMTFQSSDTVPAGYFAGFDIKNSGILDVNVLGSFSVKTYLGNTLQESKGSDNGLIGASLLNASGVSRLGFVTTKPFDRLMFEQSFGIKLSVNSTEIYNPVIQKLCAETQPRPCNVNEYWKTSEFPVSISVERTGTAGTACVNCEIVDAAKIIDSDTSNYAEIKILLGVGNEGSIAVRNAMTVYPAGSFAGFEVDDQRAVGVGVGVRQILRTYLDGKMQDSVGTGNATLSTGVFTSTGKKVVGFKTTKPFDEIRFTAVNVLGLDVGSPIKVYGAIVNNFCAGDTLACNIDTRLKQGDFPVFVDVRNTGIDAVACVNCDIINANYAVDNIDTNFTQIVLPVGVATTATYAITDGKTVYNNNPEEPVFAGFEIDNPALLNLQALQNVSIATTLDGVVQETVPANTGLVSLGTGLLNGSSHQILGFIPSGPFNGVKLILDGTLDVNLGTTRIYGAVFKKLCKNDLGCNTLTALAAPTHPVYVSAVNTGFEGVACVGCSIDNAENLVKDTGYASIDMVASVGAIARIAVTNALETYPAESFAGFEIESAALLSANVISNLSISLYNKGEEVQSGTGTALLVGAQTALLGAGNNRQIVGIISRVPFDEVQLKIVNIVSADLGEVKVYNAYVQSRCEQAVACNTGMILNSTTSSAVINAANTGVQGGVCVDCGVEGAWAVVSADENDYARLRNTATVLVQSALSVATPAYTYPAGTFAGFQVKKNNFIIAADLLQYITIVTLNDGVEQESKSGASLLDLRVLIQLLGENNNVYIPGFYTTKPFDEVQIKVGSLVNALDNYIDVQGAFVDTRSDAAALGLNCFVSNPDFAVTPIHVSVSGSLAANVQLGFVTSTYGPSAGIPSGHANPSAALPVINNDGTYSFVADVPGVYEFLIPVCFGDGTDNCISQIFTITVADDVPKSVKNPPVVNTDVVSTKYNTHTVIHAIANDEPGAPDLQLNPATVNITDLNGATAGNTSRGGTATVNPVTGDITYTPPIDFVGPDTIRYTVCDNQTPAKCGSAFVVVKVLTPGMANNITIADDFYTLDAGQPVHTINAANGVLTNDADLEGSSLSANPVDTTIAGKGRFQLAADGSFSFTPEPGFRGTVVIPYTATSTGEHPATASGTVQIMVKAFVPDLTPVLTITPDSVHGTTNVNYIVEVKEINVVPTEGEISVYVLKSKLMPIVLNTTITELNGIAVQNAHWTLDATTNSGYYILKTTETITAGGKLTIGLSGTFTPGAANGRVNSTVSIYKFSGGEENSKNNSSSVAIHYFEK